jgi:arylsulfatase A-like enzyme
MKPNFLFIMVDELRAPVVYETSQIKAWRKQYLTAQNRLKKRGFQFLNHYVAQTACTPSRTAVQCGQYGSLTGVNSTDGAAKTAFDSDMFWLDPNTVPTMGAFFSAAGYRTFYHGKWHVSHADIVIPGTHTQFVSYDPNTGIPNARNTLIYEKANRLADFGWSTASFEGGVPHGTEPANSGSSSANIVNGRDIVYTDTIVNVITQLGQSDNKTPFIFFASLVNPHDQALYGDLTKLLPNFNFVIDPSVPNIPPSPSANEDLSTKPSCQADYKVKYQEGFQPTTDDQDFRKLYYSLTLEVDRNVNKILDALKNSGLDENTIVIFTSDHGDYLGAHGLFQKWYTVYEEATHVPLIIAMPKKTHSKYVGKTDAITSHIDLLPTLLSLAGIDEEKIALSLKTSHSEVRKLVGRDLSSLILNKCNKSDNLTDGPIYFIGDDDVLLGQNMIGWNGKPYTAVVQPNHIEAVIVALTRKKGHKHIWKYARYFDNTEFWSNPGISDQLQDKREAQTDDNGSPIIDVTIKTTKTIPIPDQYEMYNITLDPLELKNLADPKYSTPKTKVIQVYLAELLQEQSRLKRLTPTGSERKILPLFPKPS